MCTKCDSTWERGVTATSAHFGAHHEAHRGCAAHSLTTKEVTARPIRKDLPYAHVPVRSIRKDACRNGSVRSSRRVEIAVCTSA